MKSLALALVFLLIVIGCNNEVRQGQSQRPRADRAAKERLVSQLIDEFKKAKTNTNAALAAFKELASHPASENAQVWIDVATDRQYSDLQRRKALFAFFTRHIRPKTPMPLAELLRFSKMDTLLVETNVLAASAFSHIPVTRVPSGSAFMLQPDFLERSHAAVFFSVYRSFHGPAEKHPGAIGENEFLECAKDIQKAKAVKIIEVAISE